MERIVHIEFWYAFSDFPVRGNTSNEFLGVFPREGICPEFYGLYSLTGIYQS